MRPSDYGNNPTTSSSSHTSGYIQNTGSRPSYVISYKPQKPASSGSTSYRPSQSASTTVSTPATAPAPAVSTQPAFDQAAADRAFLERTLESQRRAQEQALAELRAAQEAERRAREEAYQKAAAAQKSTYDNNVGQLNNTTEDALREAYINRMLSQRNLQQQLSAQGISGGASETTQASMLNNYESSRNDLEKERQRQLSDLMQTYQNNMAALEQQRASGDAASLGQYQLALANLAANNGVDLLSMIQGSTATGQNTPSAHYINGEWIYY